jgi:hypothetical protein
MTEPRIIDPKEIEAYSLDEISALQDVFGGCCFWSDDITHIDRDGIRLTRETVGAMGDRLDVLMIEQDEIMRNQYNRNSARIVRLAEDVADLGDYEEADRSMRNYFNRLPKLASAEQARQRLSDAHTKLVGKAAEDCVTVPPLRPRVG